MQIPIIFELLKINAKTYQMQTFMYQYLSLVVMIFRQSESSSMKMVVKQFEILL